MYKKTEEVCKIFDFPAKKSRKNSEKFTMLFRRVTKKRRNMCMILHKL